LNLIRNRQRDHALRIREHLLRINTLVRIAFEPRHFAVLLFVDPILKFARVVRRSRSGEAAIVEAKFECALANLFFQ
jgi:chlorite dismutase